MSTRISLFDDVHALRIAQEATVAELVRIREALEVVSVNIAAVARALSPPEDIVGITIEPGPVTTH